MSNESMRFHLHVVGIYEILQFHPTLFIRIGVMYLTAVQICINYLVPLNYIIEKLKLGMHWSIDSIFDGLPIHKMMYYQTYNNLTSDQLNNAMDSTGKQQDCLGMTPLHILACSTVQRIESYKVLIKKYSENLVIKDRWGALPIFYALWGDAPDEIIQFLVESYQSIYPNYVFDWSDMVEVLGTSMNTLTNVIEKLLDVQQNYFPEQCIDWDIVLQRMAERNWHRPMHVSPGGRDHPQSWESTFRFIVKCGTKCRVKAICLKKWQDDIETDIETIRPRHSGYFDRKAFLSAIQSKITQYEAIKEAASMLELVLWKNKLEVHDQSDKRLKVDMSGWRNQCRISCGANVVIGHVLPYLLPGQFQQTDSDDGENSSNSSSDDSEDESDSSGSESDSGGELSKDSISSS